MKTGLRDYDEMKQELEELELTEELNSLILKHAGSAKQYGFEVIDLLQSAFAEYVVEYNLPSQKMDELNAKMTNYIEAVVENPELTEEACLHWVKFSYPSIISE